MENYRKHEVGVVEKELSLKEKKALYGECILDIFPDNIYESDIGYLIAIQASLNHLLSETEYYGESVGDVFKRIKDFIVKIFKMIIGAIRKVGKVLGDFITRGVKIPDYNIDVILDSVQRTQMYGQPVSFSAFDKAVRPHVAKRYRNISAALKIEDGTMEKRIAHLTEITVIIQKIIDVIESDDDSKVLLLGGGGDDKKDDKSTEKLNIARNILTTLMGVIISLISFKNIHLTIITSILSNIAIVSDCAAYPDEIEIKGNSSDLYTHAALKSFNKVIKYDKEIVDTFNAYEYDAGIQLVIDKIIKPNMHIISENTVATLKKNTNGIRVLEYITLDKGIGEVLDILADTILPLVKNIAHSIQNNYFDAGGIIDILYEEGLVDDNFIYELIKDSPVKLNKGDIHELLSRSNSKVYDAVFGVNIDDSELISGKLKNDFVKICERYLV